jgi:hypothetical protein
MGEKAGRREPSARPSAIAASVSASKPVELAEIDLDLL